MERLLYHIYDQLLDEFEVAIVGPKGCSKFLQAQSPVLVCPPLPPWKFLLHCQARTLQMATAVKPDLIFSGSGVTAPAAVMGGRLLRIPVLTYLHGLDIVADSIAYRSLFLPAIRMVNGIVVNSHSTDRLVRSVGIKVPSIVLHPGITIPDPSDLDKGKAFREKFKTEARPILLSVGRLTRRKGIVEFIENCLPKIVQAHPGVLYVIIGGEPKNAIGSQAGMADRILDVVNNRGLGECVLLLQDVDDITLGHAYTAAQVLVFPVIDRPHDVEGFGMVAVEAAAHGLPTVAFAVGGVVDAVKDGVSGYLVDAGDYEILTQAIIGHVMKTSIGVSKHSCMEFAQGFSWEFFGKKLRGICWKAIMGEGRSWY
jgi:phosphatidylinositol alpha-1,6-mannosyltransferase